MSRRQDRPVLAPEASLVTNDVAAGETLQCVGHAWKLFDGEHPFGAEGPHLVERVTEHLAGRAVRVESPAARIEHDDAIDDLLGKSAVAVLARSQRLARAQRLTGAKSYKSRNC